MRVVAFALSAVRASAVRDSCVLAGHSQNVISSGVTFTRMDLIHAAIWVSDVDETVAFYRDGLGLDHNWEFTGDDGVRNVYLGGADGEIQFKYDPDGEPPSPDGGLDHLAVGVDDTDAVFDRLRERTDCPVVEPPTTMAEIGRRVAFVEDPDGYVVELVEVID